MKIKIIFLLVINLIFFLNGCAIYDPYKKFLCIDNKNKYYQEKVDEIEFMLELRDIYPYNKTRTTFNLYMSSELKIDYIIISNYEIRINNKLKTQKNFNKKIDFFYDENLKKYILEYNPQLIDINVNKKDKVQILLNIIIKTRYKEETKKIEANFEVVKKIGMGIKY